MKATSWILWGVLGLAALAPAALRSAAWLRDRTQPVDANMAAAGENLFRHEWTPHDPLSADGDGLGPVYNASSCLKCHFQNGAGGGGSLTENVTTFVVRPTRANEKPREGVIHAHSTSDRAESLASIDPSLPDTTQPTLDMLVPMPGKKADLLRFPRHIQVGQLNTPALFGAKLIDDIPERVIVANERQERLKWGLVPPDSDAAPVGRASRLANGRIGRFGWKAQTASLSAFVQAACANELGLGNPSQAQPRPLFQPDYLPPGFDLTTDQCNQLTAFVSALRRPIEHLPEDAAGRDAALNGKKLFSSIGCAECHTPDLGSVDGLYSDLLLHPMSPELQAAGSGSYGAPGPEELEVVPDQAVGNGPLAREWRTPPLWGVADSAPYMHDGRAETLADAIKLHGGQGLQSSRRFAQLGAAKQAQLVSFLKTLQAP